jgi:hypothetical protein
LFRRATVERLAAAYLARLQAIVANPEATVSSA